MSDQQAQPDNLLLTFLRRIDGKLDAIAARVGNLEAEAVLTRRMLAVISEEMAHERAA